jgi:arylsulfatase A-like enzyme
MNTPKGVMFLALAIMLTAFSCSGPESDQPLLTAKLPLHLEEHLEAARIEGSEIPQSLPIPVEWRFDEPQSEWKSVTPLDPSVKPVRTVRTEDALRLILDSGNVFVGPFGGRLLKGSIYTDLSEWRREDWAYVIVRARSTEKIDTLGVGFNLRQQPGPTANRQGPFRFGGEYVQVIKDGSIHTYLIRADWSWGEWEGPWRQLGIEVNAREPASIDILSVSVIPKEANYASSRVGVSSEVRSNAYRRTLYTHVQGRLTYRVRVPENGRLDVGLGVLREDVPVTFRIRTIFKNGKEETLLEETYADKEHWRQRTVDLSPLANKTVLLTLEAAAEPPGTVALWAAPTLTGKRTTGKPNIIFYIIDGAARDAMSVYGYNRRNTPNLERLAAEGAVFENAYSNSSWSKTSTPSFMTSLHNSVLGGYLSDSDPLPDQAVTMAQHFHKAEYQTAVFTSNPYAGTMSSLDRDVDTLREAGVEPNSKSSEELHTDFWRWRKDYPGEPYWVHFQTMDVHWPRKPSAPFAGLYVKPDLRERYYEWERRLAAAAGLSAPTWPHARTKPELFEKTNIHRAAFYDTMRGLYDETMAHNDYQIGQLVARLKAAGEWERTLLIVAADHGSTSLAGVIDPFPRQWGSCYYSYTYGIPMIIVWPGHILPRQRFSQPVSMIDMLPTILELAGLPMPEVMQGQSLAPLLLGKKDWEPRPVIIDEFYFDKGTGKLSGALEVIDGRWVAYLEINPPPESEDQPPKKKRPPMLLYDLWHDPYYGGSVHEKRPNLVKKYTEFLKAEWKAHQELARHFTRATDTPMTPEQLRTLRSLGYIK